jgi:hypothetical protein
MGKWARIDPERAGRNGFFATVKGERFVPRFVEKNEQSGAQLLAKPQRRATDSGRGVGRRSTLACYRA